MSDANDKPRSMWEKFAASSPMEVLGKGGKALAVAATLAGSGYAVSAPSAAQADSVDRTTEAYTLQKDVESYDNYLGVAGPGATPPSFEKGKTSLVDFAAEHGLSGADAIRAARQNEGARMGLAQIPGLDGGIANRAADLRPLNEQMVTFNLLRRTVGEPAVGFADGTGERKKYHSMGRWAEEQALVAHNEGRAVDARRFGNFALTSISEMQRMPDENHVDLTRTSLSHHAGEQQLRGPEALTVARAQPQGARGLGEIGGIDMERAESWATLRPSEFTKKVASMVTIASRGAATAGDAGFGEVRNPADIYGNAARWGEKMALRAHERNDPMAPRYAELSLAGMSAKTDLERSRQQGARGTDR